MKKYFGSINMTWLKVIALAVISAIITAVVNLIPALNDTSFQNFAVYVDAWILLAIFIIVNCKNGKEAAIKTFVFFLVSQPLIYLIQVPFNPLGWGIFGYYKYWFIVTLLTIPGSIIAYQVKRKDWLSVVVLSIATCYLGYQSVQYLIICLHDFPRQLIGCLFCLILAVFLIFILLEDKKHKLVAVVLLAVTIIVTSFVTKLGFNKQTIQFDLGQGNWQYQIEDDSLIEIKIENTNVTITAIKDGQTFVDFISDDITKSYSVTINYGNIFISNLGD